jgi:hypothetical protein
MILNSYAGDVLARDKLISPLDDNKKRVEGNILTHKRKGS